jgi:hypothetical protein
MAKQFFSQTTFEPKRKFRFMVSFGSPELDSGLRYMVTGVNKPAYEVKETAHQVLNHVFKFPGMVTWNNVTCTFIDAVDPDVGSSFYAALLNSGYMKPTDENKLATGITKNQSHHALGEVKIMQLDGGSISTNATPQSLDNVQGDTRILETWVLKNAFIKSVKFGEGMKYGAEELVEISTEIVYDYAEMKGPEIL